MNEIRQNWEKYFVPEEIMVAIEKEGFTSPTEIQKSTLPYAIRDRLDILGAAATGTGKTLAFGIPMVTRILIDKKREIEEYEAQHINSKADESDVDMDEDAENVTEEEFDLEPSGSELENTWNDGDINPQFSIGVDNLGPKVDNAMPYQHIYGLVLTPTRELACQVADHLLKICQFTDLKVCAIFGGMSVEKQERLLSYRPEIVVVTPGRFWSFINDQDLHAVSCTKMSVLVLDEADRLLEKGHFVEVEHLMEWLRSNSVSKQRQTFVFSATLTFVHSSLKKEKRKINTKDDKLRKIVSDLGMRGTPKIIDTTLEVAQLKQWKILCATQEDKDSRIFWFIKKHAGRTLVFANSKNSVRRLTSVLKQLGLHPKPLFADMQEKNRLKNLESFTKNANSLMIASDVAARGLDIPRVDFVIHFDVAHTAETHVHRSGRTARATHSGHSIIMVSPKEVGQLKQLFFSLKTLSAEDIVEIPVKNIKNFEKIVSLARKLESENHITTKIDKDKEWFTKMAEEADLVLDEEFVPVMTKTFGDKKLFNKMKADLNKMLIDIDKSQDAYVSPITALGVLHEKSTTVTLTTESDFRISGKKKRKNKSVLMKQDEPPKMRKIK